MARQQTQTDTIQQVMDFGIEAGAFHVVVDEVEGRTITVDGQRLVNFGSCSYLGLEKHPAMIEAVTRAVRAFGTQFSSSRSYISIRSLARLEERLSEMYDGHAVVVGPSTTGLHAAAIPALVHPDHALLLDERVHASIFVAANHVRVKSAHADIIPHNRIDVLREKVRELKGKHDVIWYFCEGIYSMYGNRADFAEILQLLKEEERLRLYIDDAHGMSWAGKNGCGQAFEEIGRSLHGRAYLAVSLNKAFACAGGALVFPNKEDAHRVRVAGTTLIFSGPIQPPMLGAALASADIHLSDEINVLQRALRERMDHARAALRRVGLPVFFEAPGPVLFVPAGKPQTTFSMLRGMREDGYFLDAAVFPGVPMKRGGVRFTITTHQALEDIDAMVDRLAYWHARVLKEEGIAVDDLRREFRLETPKAAVSTRSSAVFAPTSAPVSHELRVEAASSAAHLDAAEWDRIFGPDTLLTHRSLLLFESVFPPTSDAATKDRWNYRYLVVRDAAGTPVAATWCSAALMKSDFLASDAVSAKVEARRAEDPLFLTERMALLGSQLSIGSHLFVDAEHPAREAAFGLLVTELQRFQEETGSNTLALRDVTEPVDPPLAKQLFALGFSKQMLPDSFTLDVTWKDDEGHLETLKADRRWKLKQVMRDDAKFETRVLREHPGQELGEHCYGLYKSVQRKSLLINTFPMPYALFEAMYADPHWEVVLLYAKDGGRTLPSGAPAPVAAGLCTLSPGGTYVTLTIGLDYGHMPKGTYDQALLCTVRRAKDAGARRIELGFTADLNKRRMGARRVGKAAFVLLRDHAAATVMETI